MSFRQQRRRRMLSDETPDSLGDSVEDAPSSGASLAAPREAAGNYTAAARRDQQPRLVEFIPQRWTTFVLWLLVGVLLVAGLETLYSWRAEIAALAPGAAEIVDLAAPGSLAAWFSSVLLGLGGLGATLIYSLRRHRVDDYHGRYRVWLWIAAACVLLSVNETTLWHRLAGALVVPLAQRSGLTEVAVTLAACGLLATYLAVRLVLEIRHCRTAEALLVATLLAWLGSSLVRWEGLQLDEQAHGVMWAAAARLAGHLLFLTCLGVYARHVMLDAEGRLPARRAKAKRVKKQKAKKEAAESSAGAVATRVDPPQKANPHFAARSDLSPVARSVGAPAGASKADDDDEDADTDHGDSRGLSRAERKRLRRQQRQLARER